MNSKKPRNHGFDGFPDRSHQDTNDRQPTTIDNASIEVFPRETFNVYKTVYENTTAAICIVEVVAEGEYCYLDFNPACESWLGTGTNKLKGKTPQEVFASQNFQLVLDTYNSCVRSKVSVSYEACLTISQRQNCWLTVLQPQIDEGGKVFRLISTSTNIDRRLEIQKEIQQQLDREKLLSEIALKLGKSLDLSAILQQTVEKVRSFLDVDRVIVYRFAANLAGKIVAESVEPPWHSIIDRQTQDSCFTSELVGLYYQGRIQAIEDLDRASISTCYRELLRSCQVKANLVVPIVAEAKLWGLAIAQHCRSPRKWQPENIQLLQELANRVGLAIQQAELHQKVQTLNASLEAEVEQRTSQFQATLAKLRQALKSEELLGSITKAIRDSLEEKQVLQTTTKTLTTELQLECCQVELYNQEASLTEVICEYPIILPDEQGISRQVNDFPELYNPLRNKQSIHFVDLVPTVGYRQQQVTRLVCPIFDDREIFGNLWLMRPKESVFEPEEIKLVEQIADRCAIAIRQARLYRTEQVQVKELERLNLIKDDFLKTISHELRTPMSRLRLAISTLENLLEVELGSPQSAKIDKVMEIFHSSFKQQNQLVDDLLTLCYVDITSKPEVWQTIDLKTWIPQVVKTFSFSAKQQQLQLSLTEDLPLLRSDPKMLKRIVNELLNNAYKYTPEGGQIAICTEQNEEKLLLMVTNTGIEIPFDEQERIFDKFYRIPSNDPWQHGGTGIGLALVKKLVELLEAEITVSSQEQTTTFTIGFNLS